MIRFVIEMTDVQCEQVKKLASKNAKEIGPVNYAFIEKQRRARQLLIARRFAQVIGFCNFHIRRDGILTVYEILVAPEFRDRGVGQGLIDETKRLGKERGASAIFLKCPEEQPANEFYRALGFSLIGNEPGKKRRLNAWRLALPVGFRREEEERR